MEELNDKTVIFVSHQLLSTMEVDRIYCLDQGRIAEVGTHQELIKKNGICAGMYKVQQEKMANNVTEEYLKTTDVR